MSHALSVWASRISDATQDLAASRNAQLVATALLSGGVVASSILGYQAYRRDANVKELKRSIPPLSDDAVHNKTTVNGTAAIPNVGGQTQALSKEDERSVMLAARARSGGYDDDLILEQLARNRVFLKDEGLSKLRASFIVIVGCGGVGSHAAAALARSGVPRIRLVDFDQVTLSSLNRHALATLADVGTPKVHCIRRRLEQITPWVHFDCRNELFSKDVADEQLEPWDGKAPTYVVDAIDNIDSKVDLLKYCYDKGLPVISSMGAGCKSDPTRLFIGDISTSIEDPLSRSTRRRLKLKGIPTGIPVVFSSEKATPDKAALLPLSEEEFQKGNVGDLGVMPDFRVRILPVLGTMPAMFGLCIANHIMLSISGYPYQYMQGKGRDKMNEAIHNALQSSEERLARKFGEDATGLRIPVSQEDTSYLVEEIYRSHSVVSALPARLALSRWAPIKDKSQFVRKDIASQKYTDLKMNDLVCMTKDEAARHEELVLVGGQDPSEIYPPSVLEAVKSRMAEEAQYAKYR